MELRSVQIWRFDVCVLLELLDCLILLRLVLRVACLDDHFRRLDTEKVE